MSFTVSYQNTIWVVRNEKKSKETEEYNYPSCSLQNTSNFLAQGLHFTSNYQEALVAVSNRLQRYYWKFCHMFIIVEFLWCCVYNFPWSMFFFQGFHQSIMIPYMWLHAILCTKAARDYCTDTYGSMNGISGSSMLRWICTKTLVYEENWLLLLRIIPV